MSLLSIAVVLMWFIVRELCFLHFSHLSIKEDDVMEKWDEKTGTVESHYKDIQGNRVCYHYKRVYH